MGQMGRESAYSASLYFCFADCPGGRECEFDAQP